MPAIWIDGIWTGIGYQQEGVTWTIKLTVDEGKNEFLIEYPSLNSSGIWKLLEKDSAADRYTFQEAILNNDGNTLDGGRVVITKVNDNYMSFSYFRPPWYETVTSYSTLKRE
jgi:hypothetical protein